MTDLRQLLDDVAGQAKHYDITERALVGGRRRRNRRRLVVSTSAALAVTSVVIGLNVLPQRQETMRLLPQESPIGGATTCTVHELPPPPGYPRQSFIQGGDPTGRYLVGQVYRGDNQYPVIWDNGVAKAVPMQGTEPRLHDVTATGVAVGSSLMGDDAGLDGVPWVYRDGSLSRLKGFRANAMAINERETVVGRVNNLPGVWRTATAAPEPLPLPPGSWLDGSATGINEEGYIIGWATPRGPTKTKGGGPIVALLWRPDGSVHQLALPQEYRQPTPYVQPWSIQGDWITGTLTALRGGTAVSLRWRISDGAVQALPDIGFARVINRLGWIASVSPPRLTTGPGQTMDLPTDIPGYRGMKLPDGSYRIDANVSVISDDGRTLAGTLNNSEPEKPFGSIVVQWTCS